MESKVYIKVKNIEELTMAIKEAKEALAKIENWKPEIEEVRK